MTEKTKTEKTAKAKAVKTQTKAEKPTEIQNKSQVRNAAAQASKLLRGIDNEVVAIQKAQKSLEERTAKVAQSAIAVNKLLSGISNVALATPAPAKPAPAPKPAKEAKLAKPAPAPKPAKPAKPVKPVKEAKPAKPAKPAKAAPVAKEAKPAKPAKEAKPAKADASRPALKQVIDEVLSGGPLKASAIYSEACKRYGRWSRQSVYNALKDNNKYTKSGNGADATFTSAGSRVVVTDDEAEKLIRRVEASNAVANVV